MFEEARKAGFARVRIDGLIQRLEDVTALDKKKKHTIELVIDRVTHRRRRPRPPHRLGRDRAQGRRRLGAGRRRGRGARARLQRGARLPDCGVGLPELSPQSFSFNSPLGMCVDCNGLGSSLEVDPI